MSYTKLFQRNDTYDRCEFECNISQADNRSNMFTTLLDHENIALSTSNITTLFFTLPRYAILFRVTTAPTTKKLTTLKHRFVHVQQLNNQLVFLLMCFVVVFDSNYVVLFWAAGCRIATTEPLCDEAVCTTHFHFKREQFAFAFQLVDCWVLYEMFFHCNFCLFLWWIISKCEGGRCNRCRYVTIFFLLVSP